MLEGGTVLCNTIVCVHAASNCSTNERTVYSANDSSVETAQLHKALIEGSQAVGKRLHGDFRRVSHAIRVATNGEMRTFSLQDHCISAR